MFGGLRNDLPESDGISLEMLVLLVGLIEDDKSRSSGRVCLCMVKHVFSDESVSLYVLARTYLVGN